MKFTKIISGGQTGADRAALDFAIRHGIPHGGWVPKGRLTEAGPLPRRYHVQEMPRRSYAARTEQNVLDADATLIVSHGKLTGGSRLTRQYAKRHQRLWLHIDLDHYTLLNAAALLSRWLDSHPIQILNVAGPRASKDQAIYHDVMRLLKKAFFYRTVKIEAVLFDFGGVIAEEGWKEGLDMIARANGLDPGTFLKTAADTIYETGYILGKCTAHPFWSALREKTGIKDDDASIIRKILSHFIPRDWMIELVKGLGEAGITVGILSDQTEMLDTLNARYDFFRWFDHVFNSYHMGKGKRDATLFDDIAQYLQLPPHRILFIDDDPGHVERADKKGWHAILYVDQTSFKKEFEKYLANGSAPIKSLWARHRTI
ncbi:MAG: hypothetical protein GX147_05685 [Deltaproteobacteria bacterium]|nr:hypothetical protein [Deltaproteobacteria bacterium]